MSAPRHDVVEHRSPGLVLREHRLEVPLDHADPAGEPRRLEVFAREVADPDGLDRPYLVYLQGGPGHEAPVPTRHPSSPVWLDRALQDFRVLLLDQRGTGRSTPVGDLAGLAPHEQAAYLTHFRADAIVADCELLREALGSGPWSVLGQSFGGFCALRYLSAAPHGLREALFTGGVPPIGSPVDEIYAITHGRAIERSRRHYARYPEDRARVRELLRRADAGELTTLGGDRIGPGRVRQLGIALGMSDGSEQLHGLLELDPASPAFRRDAELALDFARTPLYAIVHEACYADGGSTRWSAERTAPVAAWEQEPELLCAEHVFPWMFEDIAALAPLRTAADLLSDHEWPRLYDEDALAANEVPAAAAIDANDLYVDSRLSLDTVARVPGLRPWLTDELEHNGLRVDGARVLSRLLDLTRGRA